MIHNALIQHHDRYETCRAIVNMLNDHQVYMNDPGWNCIMGDLSAFVHWKKFEEYMTLDLDDGVSIMIFYLKQ
uniref:Dynein light chain n=1 Tax=Acrobeloides nanus TaxID=290746 RepID=A0A914DC08_9BILA